MYYMTSAKNFSLLLKYNAPLRAIITADTVPTTMRSHGIGLVDRIADRKPSITPDHGI
jgi:hypothetical protein